MIELRIASDAELDAWASIWNVVTPADATTAERQRERRERDPRRLNLLAFAGGTPVGCGYAGPSDAPTRGNVAPRVLPDARRRGVGTALLRRLCAHVHELGLARTGSSVVGGDDGSLAFARRFGFDEVNRQLEQVRELGDEPEPVPPPGVTFLSVEERPDLLRAAYDLGVAGWADMATPVPVTISLDDWLRDEATYPGGSFVALADADVVGYSGLCRVPGSDDVAEDGLTVVRRDWRRRGLATALKRAELAWAARNGVRRVETWTQTGNEGMRAVNERLGFRYGLVQIDVARDLPLEPLRAGG